MLIRPSILTLVQVFFWILSHFGLSILLNFAHGSDAGKAYQQLKEKNIEFDRHYERDL